MASPNPPVCDDGFTLVEMAVALAIVAVVMASVGVFFVRGQRAVRLQGEQQTAAQFALDGVEEARMLRGGALIADRSGCTSSASCPDPAPYGAAAAVGSAWLGRIDMGTATARLAPPAYPDQQVVEGLTYERRFYVRQCWAAATGGGACADTKSAAAPAPFYRVIVVISWKTNGCAATRCSFVTSTLFTGTLSDPVFAAA